MMDGHRNKQGPREEFRLARARAAAGMTLSPKQRQIMQRLEECEKAMAECLDSYKVQRTLAQRWGTSKRRVRSYIQVIRKQREKEAAHEEARERRRNDVRAAYQHTYSRALELDRPGDAAKALDSLCSLDALRDESGAPDVAALIRAANGLPKTEQETQALMSDLREAEPDSEGWVEE